MSNYPPAAPGPPSLDAVDHSERDVEASDGTPQTRPDAQPSDSQIDDGESGRSTNEVEHTVMAKVVPVRAERVSSNTDYSTCVHPHIEDAVP